MAVFVAMVSALLRLPGPLIESREAGIYRSLKINGLPAPSILFIPALSTIIPPSAAPLFGGELPTSWGEFALVTPSTILAFGAFGALIGVVATGARSKAAAQGR